MASYNKDTDYKALIEKAAAKGDYVTAAKQEQQRNSKIENEGLDYQTTSDYAGWLDTRDYGEEIKSAISSGGSREKVYDLLSSRVQKASSTRGMDQWIRDDIYDMALDYLVSGDSYAPYESPYGDRISQLIDRIYQREPFSYDYESDPLYKAYAAAYQREGKRAAEDTLGSVSGSTGGYASSYAVTASQQARNYYGSMQADKVPELYRMAYEIYLEEGQADLDALSALGRMEEMEYQKYLDSRDAYYESSRLELEKYLAELDAEAQAAERQYEAERDRIEDMRYEREWQYMLDRDRIDDLRYELENSSSAKSPSGSGKASSSKARQSSSKENQEEDGEEIRVYGLSGTYTRQEAEAMIVSGIAEKVKSGSKWIYKLKAIS